MLSQTHLQIIKKKKAPGGALGEELGSVHRRRRIPLEEALCLGSQAGWPHRFGGQAFARAQDPQLQNQNCVCSTDIGSADFAVVRNRGLGCLAVGGLLQRNFLQMAVIDLDHGQHLLIEQRLSGKCCSFFVWGFVHFYSFALNKTCGKITTLEILQVFIKRSMFLAYI